MRCSRPAIFSALLLLALCPIAPRANAQETPELLPASAPWNLFAADGMEAVAAREGDAIRIKVGTTGANYWDVQLQQHKLDLESGKTYTLRYQAKADGRRQLSLNAQADGG